LELNITEQKCTEFMALKLQHRIKSDNSKNSFYEKMEQVFYQFCIYYMKILLDLNAKLE
jgi:hypothetical protein